MRSRADREEGSAREDEESKRDVASFGYMESYLWFSLLLATLVKLKLFDATSVKQLIMIDKVYQIISQSLNYFRVLI